VTDLRLFGCIHANTRSIVESDLDSFAADVDAFAIEDPIFDDPRELCRAFLAVPVVAIGLNVLGLLQTALFAVVHRDIVQVELSAVERVAGDRPVHSVDRHPLALIADRGWPWILGNWAVLVGLVVFDPVSTLLVAGLALVVSLTQRVRRRWGYRYPALALAGLALAATGWLVATGYLDRYLLGGLVLGAAVVVYVTLGPRNEVMLDEVAGLAADHEYDELCLLTGKMHVDGMCEIAPERGLTVTGVFRQRFRESGIELDPTAESPGAGTAVQAGGLLRERALARLCDWLFLGVVVVLWLFVASVLVSSAGLRWQAQVVGLPIDYLQVTALPVVGIPMAYYAILEGKRGQTVGKQALGLRVRRRDGRPLAPTDAAVRSLYGWLDFLPVCQVVGAIAAYTDDDGRRLADRLAGTVVVAVDHSAASTGEDGTRSVGDAANGDGTDQDGR